MKVLQVVLLGVFAISLISAKSIKFIEESYPQADNDTISLLSTYPDCFKSFYRYGIKGFDKNTCNGLEFYSNAAHNLQLCLNNTGAPLAETFSTVLGLGCTGSLVTNYCVVPMTIFNTFYSNMQFVSSKCAPWEVNPRYLPPCKTKCNDGSAPQGAVQSLAQQSYVKPPEMRNMLKNNKILIMKDMQNNWGLLVKLKWQKTSYSMMYSLTLLTIDNSNPDGYTLIQSEASEMSGYTNVFLLQ